ncbi:MFS transporter [Rhodococcus hoagii]|nr:MFS transporter [Prescottella equi]
MESKIAEVAHVPAVERPYRQIAAAVVGNLIEWYDWYIYSLLAVYFAEQYFPERQRRHLVPLLAALGVFAVGFFMRPLGSLFPRRLGDRYGRKKALQTTVSLMGVGSLLIGCLPRTSRSAFSAPGPHRRRAVAPGVVHGRRIRFRLGISRRIGPSEPAGVSSRASSIWARRPAMLQPSVCCSALGNPRPSRDGVMGMACTVSDRRCGVVVRHLDSVAAWRPSPRVKRPRGGVRGWNVRLRPAASPSDSAGGRDATRTSVAFYTWVVFLPTYAQITVGFDRAESIRIGLISLIFFWAVVPLCGWASDKIGVSPSCMPALSPSPWARCRCWGCCRTVSGACFSCSGAAWPRWRVSRPLRQRSRPSSFPARFASSVIGFPYASQWRSSVERAPTSPRG